MKSIALICFGKLKTPGFAAAVGEFSKRLTQYCEFQTYELKPQGVQEKSASVRKRVTSLEARQVLEMIQTKSFTQRHGKNIALCALDESGKSMPTQKWSELLEREWEQNRTPVFLIGSGLGHGDSILQQSSQLLSLGPQTLSHELARLVLCEQLYRAASFLSGHPYHNAD